MSKKENSSCSDTADPSMVNFGFGFNDTDFSDRVLRIEITEDSLDSKDFSKDNVVQVKTLHISSLVVAASSPFFYKLFKNGMRESQEKDLTLRINASEESALMDILKFINSHTLSATTTPDLLAVLIVADKFEVTSCVRYCTRLLQKVPMSLQSALSYLQLPSSVLLSESVQPLIVATKDYLVTTYSDFDKFRKELMDLPLCVVEVILGTDGLQVNSEDDVFDFVLEWASVHYPELNERRKIIADHLVQCICFHFMSCSKLREVLVCPDFGHEQVSKLVLETLFLKAEVPYLQGIHGSKEVANTSCCSLVRMYKYRPIKVVQFEFAQPRCVVYFDLTKEECANLFKSPPRGYYLYSQSFCLGGRWFYLTVRCYTNEQPNSFALYLWTTTESESCTLDYEFGVIKKPSTVFQKITDGNYSYSQLLSGIGRHNLFDTSWSDFMKEDSEYFIDGILHLRADLTIK